MTQPIQARTKLSEVLPLQTPFIVQIFPVYACNFKCEYCIYSVPVEKRGYISKETLMDMELYQKSIDDMTSFPQQIKMLRFAGMGEPLLHPQIAEMIRYAQTRKVAKSVEIVTNGGRLTHDLSLKLIDSGLSRLRISLEGICAEDYEKHCGQKFDFDGFVENLKFFYQNKKDTIVYIKIIDYMLKTPEEEKKFYETFSPISDQIAVEHLTPTIAEIDYTQIAGYLQMNKSQNGETILNTQICSTPFYFMQINPDGNVVPCCNTKYPCVLGNAARENVVDLWNGTTFYGFRRKLLDGVQYAGEVCEQCNIYLYGTYPEDLLDGDAPRLKKIFDVAGE